MKTSYLVNSSPSVRRLAREKGVDLAQLSKDNPDKMIRHEDVLQASGAPAMKQNEQNGNGHSSALPVVNQPDWSQFGQTETVALSRIQKVSASHLHSAWLNAPQVTHFDEADITELEAYRQQIKDKAKAQGVSLTPLCFMLKAVVSALKAYPRFNCAINDKQDELIQRHYYHIGVAVDTPNGLVVPVLRDVDKKPLFTLAAELTDVSSKARAGKLSMAQMQGGCFSISSLGSIGGTQFTPIVNSPEVGILGLSRAKKTIIPDENNQPITRLIQPLAVSYDHRVVDGACAAQFTKHLAASLTDVRQLILDR